MWDFGNTLSWHGISRLYDFTKFGGRYQQALEGMRGGIIRFTERPILVWIWPNGRTPISSKLPYMTRRELNYTHHMSFGSSFYSA